MRKNRRITATVVKDRKLGWIVQINYPDGSKVIAKPEGARVHFDHLERVPRDLRFNVVPGLVARARVKNLTGE